MEVFQLMTEQIVSLKALHRTLRDRKKADCVKAIVLLDSGWTPQEVAEVLLVDEKAVRTWFEKYHLSVERKNPSLFGIKANLRDSTKYNNPNLRIISTKTRISAARKSLIASKRRTT